MAGNNFQLDTFLQNDLSLFLLILSVTLIGSFVKAIFTPKTKRTVSLRMVYASSFVVSILLFSSSTFIFKYFPGRSFLGVCIVAGLVSVEITTRLTTIEGIKNFIDEFIAFKRRGK
jgi:hypothetical protein